MSTSVGVPVGVELASDDPERARGFYRSVFGWRWDAAPDEHGVETARLDGGAVAGLRALPAGALAPAHWTVRIGVDSVVDACTEVEAGGGQIIAPEGDPAPAGPTVACRDPLGARFTVGQGAEGRPGERRGSAGGHVWSELLCGDCPRALEFYGALFGWFAEPGPAIDGATTYLLRSQESQPVGGMRDPGSGLPAMWLVYIGCDDADRCAAEVVAAGGAVAIAPTDTPHGRMGVALDCLGAPFAFVSAVGG